MDRGKLTDGRRLRRVLAGALAGFALAAPLPAISTMIPAPPVPQAPCAEVPGFNDKCPAWATQYPSAETLGDGCTEEAAHQVVGTEGVYLSATRICSGFDIQVLAYSYNGDLMWSFIHNGAANRRDHVFNLAVSPDGHHLFVVGSEGVGDTSDWVVIALNAITGEREWIAHHDGPAQATDEAWLAAVSQDGERLYVSGFDSYDDVEGEERADTLTIAYDAKTGESLWAIRFDSDHQLLDFPRAIGVRGDRVVITGSSLELLGTQDLQTVVYRDDRGTGSAEELWRASYDGGDWDQPAMTCISRQSPSCLGLMGSVVVTDEIVGVAGTSFVDPATDDSVWTTIGYDVETGERKWLRQFGDPAVQNKANAIAAAPDGRTIYVTGFTNDDEFFDGVGDAAAVAYDAATGEERWRSNFALSGVEDAAGFGVVASEDTVYLSGQVQVWFDNGFRSEVLTIAHDAATGEQKWVGRHSRTIPVIGNGDRGHWIDLSPDGTRLFVGGGFANSLRLEDRNDTWDLGLLAYDVP
jgi:hypothetical protein